MTNQQPQVNPPVEPQLFPGGALSITAEALLDPEEGTVVFIVRAWNVPTGKLIALWSSAPVPFDNYYREERRALSEWRRLVLEHSGPF